MKILVVASTYPELEGVLQAIDNHKCPEENFFRGYAGTIMTDFQVTGIGSVATAEKLAQRLMLSNYNLVLNIGICGSFREDLRPGITVNIVAEAWGDLGAEDHDDFRDLFDLGFLVPGEKPFTGRELVNPGHEYSAYFQHLKQVRGITVNKAHGNMESIEKCLRKFSPEVESMEGAAVFSCCLKLGINFQCLRSISNFVEPRDRSKWEIETAINSLSAEVNRILREISN